MFLFFFFKQKTAYEMRISDWSSDVCSSDLSGGAAHGAAMHAGFAIWRIAVHGQRFVGVVVELANPADAARFVAVGDFAAEFARDTHQLLDLLDRTRFALAEIGRAHV